ncbi:MAG: hypothetical protein ACYCZ0_03140, partial [Minisyncoccota bacterium]
MKILRTIVVVAIAAILSGLAFAAFSYRHAYYTLRSTFTKFEAQCQTERTRLSQRSSLWHAKVVRVDIPGNQLTVTLGQQILAGAENVAFTMRVTETTLFVRQSLIASNGAYVGFSETASGSLSDLTPGMRIA